MDLLIFIIIVSSGLFTGGVLTIAWDRLPAWKVMPIEIFKMEFRRTIRVADILQPALIIITIISTIIFGLQTDGIAGILAFIAAAGYIVILLLSLAILVPMQRQILALQQPSDSILKWSKGHLGRTVLAVISFVISSSAIALSY